jgi:uncharacterized membrane protein
VRGVSIGMSFMPAMTAAFASMRPDQLSDATPQLNVVMRFGGAIGTAVLAVVLERAGAGTRQGADLAAAFDTAYWWALGMSLLSLIPTVALLRAERRGGARVRAREATAAETAAEALV